MDEKWKRQPQETRPKGLHGNFHAVHKNLGIVSQTFNQAFTDQEYQKKEGMMIILFLFQQKSLLPVHLNYNYTRYNVEYYLH